jgi:hypothetical protein
MLQEDELPACAVYKRGKSRFLQNDDDLQKDDIQ